MSRPDSSPINPVNVKWKYFTRGNDGAIICSTCSEAEYEASCNRYLEKAFNDFSFANSGFCKY